MVFSYPLGFILQKEVHWLLLHDELLELWYFMTGPARGVPGPSGTTAVAQ